MDAKKARLLDEAAKLHERFLLSKSVTPEYFEPGKMEYLEQTDGNYDEAKQQVTLRFEAKGTRYGDRTEWIEGLSVGDPIVVKRDPCNIYNANNFILLTDNGYDVGNMPAALCDVIAPLYDAGTLTVLSATVSFVDPISKRSRYAKQAMLFVELVLQLHTE